MSDESWTDFLHKEIIDNGNATHGAILSVDGNIWARTSNLLQDNSIGGEECNKNWLDLVLSGLSNPETMDIIEDVAKGSIQILNKQFVVTNIMKDRVICGKNGVDGLYIFKTQSALLLVLWVGSCYLNSDFQFFPYNLCCIL